MSANVGLSTPRGSGTSGYVQRNLSALKPRATGYGQPYSLNESARPPKIRKPDEDILKHERLRDIEVKVMELRDRLEEEGKLDDDEVEEECERVRAKMVEDMERGGKDRHRGGKNGEREKGVAKMKSYQVHELAEAKARESEKLRRALGLKGDLGDGDGEGEHPMARQERRKREAEALRTKTEEKRGWVSDEREKRRSEDDDEGDD